jgi:hypothetical protein
VIGVAHAVPTHGAAVHAVPLTQPPPAPHVCGVLPLHRAWPGAHEPVQTPPVQVWLVHAAGLPHDPASLQVSTPLPEHVVAGGEHATQALFKQAGVAPEHVVSVCQVPPSAHDWTVVPEHCVSPGAHEPVQTPPRHVWPLQATGLPHAPASLHVSALLPAHCRVVGEQATQALFRQAGVGAEHVVCVCHSPLVEHDWIALPRHWVCPGPQTPAHAPLTQVWLTHAEPLVQAPFALQLCGVLPMHRVCWGAHVPVHDPFTQVELVHVVGVPHVPMLLHVATPLFEHCVVPCTHTPVHAPFTHVVFTQATGVPQFPVASHVSTPLPEHCFVVGVHVPLHWPPVHVPMHGDPMSHCPFAVQAWTLLPWHWVWVGPQTPVQTPPTHV